MIRPMQPLAPERRKRMIEEALQSRNADPGLEPYTREELEKASDGELLVMWMRA